METAIQFRLIYGYSYSWAYIARPLTDLYCYSQFANIPTYNLEQYLLFTRYFQKFCIIKFSLKFHKHYCANVYLLSIFSSDEWHYIDAPLLQPADQSEFGLQRHLQNMQLASKLAGYIHAAIRSIAISLLTLIDVGNVLVVNSSLAKLDTKNTTRSVLKINVRCKALRCIIRMYQK